MRPTAIAGTATIIALLSAEMLLPRSWRDGFRETAFDLVLAADQRLRPATDRGGARVVVVDIDRRSLEAVGPWPWPRARIADLVDAIAAAGPAIAAIDILFADHDTRSTAALPRRLEAPTGRNEPRGPADKLPDGDQLLANAISQFPIVLGFVLDPAGTSSFPQMPVAIRGAPSLDELWRAAGAVAPPSLLTEKSSGTGALSLPADSDGVVRHVPLLVGIGGYILPGFALETVRVARGASVYLLQSAPPLLATGDLSIPFTADGLLRLRPTMPERARDSDNFRSRCPGAKASGSSQTCRRGGTCRRFGTGARRVARDSERSAHALGSYPGRCHRADHCRTVSTRSGRQ